MMEEESEEDVGKGEEGVAPASLPLKCGHMGGNPHVDTWAGHRGEGGRVERLLVELVEWLPVVLVERLPVVLVEWLICRPG